MQIRNSKPGEVRSSEITPEGVYLNRRSAVRALLGAAGASATGLLGPALARAHEVKSPARRFENLVRSPYRVDDPPTDYQYATRYNNFYEFSSDKESPAVLAASLVTRPWSVSIEGDVAKPGSVPLETLLKPHPLEERIYRFRCVEAWSMVIPWVGIPLQAVLKRFEPGPGAKFVAFETLYDPEQMPEQKTDLLDWPYTEGLRIEEAMHPLALLAVGMYGRELPNQNGAPLRLVVPWKYGFKSIKSIVKIRLTSVQPVTTWAKMSPGEYGFLANVNPDVSHPRWSQKRERRLGEFGRRDTLPFNGYQDEVASLYEGVDLEKNF